MGGTLDEFAGDVEELVGYPFQVDAGVWAAVAVNIELAFFAHYHELCFMIALV